MKKTAFLFIMIAFAFTTAHAQKTTEDSVKAAVNLLFEGMRTADAVLTKSAFSDSGLLQTIGRNKEGIPTLRNEKISDFADFVGKQTKGSVDERISFDVIRIDGNLASVWTPYKFYFNGQFRHCGVNSFQLVRFNGVWKIQYLIDTRRKEGCE